jgi:hypothetical protein
VSEQIVVFHNLGARGVALQTQEDAASCLCGNVAMTAASHLYHEVWLLDDSTSKQALLFLVHACQSMCEHGTAIVVSTDCRDIHLDRLDKPSSLLGIAMLKELLYHVISILVRGCHYDLCHKDIHESLNLLGSAMLEQTLENSASKPVLCGALHCPLSEGDLVNYELQSLRTHRHNALLQHKVCMRALQGLPDITF